MMLRLVVESFGVITPTHWRQFDQYNFKKRWKKRLKNVFQKGKGREKVNRGTSRKVFFYKKSKKKSNKKVKNKVNRVDKGKRKMKLHVFFTCFLPFFYLFRTSSASSQENVWKSENSSVPLRKGRQKRRKM